MSGLAQVLLSRGVRVSGSDPGQNAATTRLLAHGAVISTEQTAENIQLERPDIVVVTAAIHENNPELVAAKIAKIPIYTRAEYLGLLMADHSGPRIAVSGTHGKTTTTAMLASVLISGKLDPSVLVGGEYGPIGGNVRVGASEVFLTEACEAYDSFLSLKADIAIITNIEADHLDHYGTMENVFNAFRQFVSQTSHDGALIWCREDNGARQLVGSMQNNGPARRIPYGLVPEGPNSIWADAIHMQPGCSTFTVRKGNCKDLGHVRLFVPGTHNILNALAAITAGLEAGVKFDAIAQGIEEFHGTGRRFEIKGERLGALVVDDYAHHPTEILATLEAARSVYPERRLIAVFQPHLYSRTLTFMNEFARALSGFDVVILTDIYAAREEPIPGVDVADLQANILTISPEKLVIYLPNKQDIPRALVNIVNNKDVVFTIGAGDIYQVGESFLRDESSQESI